MIVLFYRNKPEQRNSQGIHAAVVSAADEAAARAALADVTGGEVRTSAWASLVLDADGEFEVDVPAVQLFEGDAITALGRSRGQ